MSPPSPCSKTLPLRHQTNFALICPMRGSRALVTLPKLFVAANVSGWVVKLRVIEDVEEFTPNLEMHCFIDWNHLRYAQIGIVDSRTVEESTVRRPERSAVST